MKQAAWRRLPPNRCPGCYELGNACDCDTPYCDGCNQIGQDCMCNYQWEWEVEFGMVDEEWERWEVLTLPAAAWDNEEPEIKEEWITKVLGRYQVGIDTDVFWNHFNEKRPAEVFLPIEIDARQAPKSKFDRFGDDFHTRLNWAIHADDHLRYSGRGFGKTEAARKLDPRRPSERPSPAAPPPGG